ncbi:hypothetical protein PK95_19125 [Salmonella enterica subsp. enterica]|nr:hypothetical protein [Salmonella enterica subsp. enterica]ECC3650181.1 hypothetical protein [Salmonella enterica subsp. enterica]ECC8682393.1 hypothetical protein [Salmonella enterica subsp. enterica]
MKKPVRLDGLLCVCGNCKNVGLISAAPSGNRHRRMAAPPDGGSAGWRLRLIRPTRCVLSLTTAK